MDLKEIEEQLIALSPPHFVRSDFLQQGCVIFLMI